MNLPYSGLRDAASALRKDYFPDFSVLPYNRWDADKSRHWWISPTSDKIAFRYGKIILTTDNKWSEPGEVFCGFNVEKGLGKGCSRNPNDTMDKKWFWHKFVDIAGTQLTNVVTSASTEAATELEVVVVAGPIEPGTDWSTVRFTTSGTALVSKFYRHGEGILREVAAAPDIPSFIATLPELNAYPWHWVDVMIGHPIALAATGPDETSRVASMLEPFLPWMQPTP